MKKLTYEELAEKLSKSESALRIEKEKNKSLENKLARKSAKATKYQTLHRDLKKN